ncbi:DUF7344 domain-containing protein [Haloarcula onubensis]|uniref:DUF7344 domain-containing protein n=1 Tax=Haloarcula onubensis TaxID=2950539 RepID=A0ABU2FRM7_9EURY|nr:hypothetical protein [Halomicroarcula sp. S3CR25-11]MDS0283413.1 hypothetical protein [Halomicroarcula sp. S3CR25-11]
MDTSSKAQSADGVELSEDRIFTLLSTRRRRELLRVVDRLGGEATVGDITNELAADEHGEQAAASQRKTVYVSLHQTHIPRLVDADVLVHDAREKTVRLTDRAEVLLAYLRFDPQKKPGLLSRVLGPAGRKRVK